MESSAGLCTDLTLDSCECHDVCRRPVRGGGGKKVKGGNMLMDGGLESFESSHSLDYALMKT